MKLLQWNPNFNDLSVIASQNIYKVLRPFVTFSINVSVCGYRKIVSFTKSSVG